MLEAEVITRIRETIAADLASRDARLQAELAAHSSKMAAHGIPTSSAEAHGRASLGSDELAIRAQMIWAAIQRCQSTFGNRENPDLLADLQEQIQEQITLQATALLPIVDRGQNSLGPRAFFRDALNAKGDELITKYKNEAHFYVRATTQAPAAAAGSVIVSGGTVYSIQTGASSHATNYIDSTSAGRLAEANVALTTAIQNAPDMDHDQRADSLEIVKDLQAAAEAKKPNGPKIRGLLSALSSTVQTVASVKPAWDTMKDVAVMVGLLPPH